MTTIPTDGHDGINERIKLVKAMEYIARQVNDEDVFVDWLRYGVADGDIEYGDLQTHDDDTIEFQYDYIDYECYINNESFAELMHTFLNIMHDAKRSGGLYCDGVCSND